MDKGVNIGGEDNSVSPLIKFFIDGKQVGKSSVVKKEWFAKMSLTVTVRNKKLDLLGTFLSRNGGIQTLFLKV